MKKILHTKGLHSASQILSIHGYQPLFLILVGQQTNSLTSILTRGLQPLPNKTNLSQSSSRKEDTSAAFLAQPCIRGGDRRKRVLLANTLQTTAAPVDSSTHTDHDLWGQQQGGIWRVWSLMGSQSSTLRIIICVHSAHTCVGPQHMHTHTNTCTQRLERHCTGCIFPCLPSYLLHPVQSIRA